jgi:hypothetical protein
LLAHQGKPWPEISQLQLIGELRAAVCRQDHVSGSLKLGRSSVQQNVSVYPAIGDIRADAASSDPDLTDGRGQQCYICPRSRLSQLEATSVDLRAYVQITVDLLFVG